MDIQNALELCVMTAIRKIGSVCGVMRRMTVRAVEEANGVLTATVTATPDAA